MLSDIFDKYRLIFSSFTRFFHYLPWHISFLPHRDHYWPQTRSFCFEGSYTYIPSLLSRTLISVNLSFKPWWANGTSSVFALSHCLIHSTVRHGSNVTQDNLHPILEQLLQWQHKENCKRLLTCSYYTDQFIQEHILKPSIGQSKLEMPRISNASSQLSAPSVTSRISGSCRCAVDA